MLLTQAIADFVARPDVSPATRTFYRDPLTRIFLPWAEAQGISEAEQITPDVVDAFARQLEGRESRKGGPLSPATRRAYLKAVQQLLSWLKQRHGLEARPDAVPLPSLRKIAREVLSRKEIDALEDAAPTERNKLLIRVMADTGAREGEVASIRLDDLIERSRTYYIRVRGKTVQNRMAPIRPALYRRLKAHAEGKTGRPKTRSPFLFMTSLRRPQGDYEPLTEVGVYRAVKDAVARAEFGRRVYPHLLRHSAITWMLHELHLDPITVSDITGVSVGVIAAHYSHPSDEQRYQRLMQALGELG